MGVVTKGCCLKEQFEFLAGLAFDFSFWIVSCAGDFLSFSVNVDDLHGHLVLSEGSGFVCANHAGAAEGFCRWKFADNGVVFGNFLHTDC